MTITDECAALAAAPTTFQLDAASPYVRWARSTAEHHAVTRLLDAISQPQSLVPGPDGRPLPRWDWPLLREMDPAVVLRIRTEAWREVRILLSRPVVPDEAQFLCVVPPNAANDDDDAAPAAE